MSAAEDVIAEAVARAYLALDGHTVAHPTPDDEDRAVAATVIEAIRNLSPDDLAEVIGGEVETRVGTERLFPDVAGITHRVRRQRVVGSWQEADRG